MQLPLPRGNPAGAAIKAWLFLSSQVEEEEPRSVHTSHGGFDTCKAVPLCSEEPLTLLTALPTAAEHFASALVGDRW